MADYCNNRLVCKKIIAKNGEKKWHPPPLFLRSYTPKVLTFTQNCVILCLEVIDVEDTMKRLQISLRPEILERLDVLGVEMGLKRSAVISLLITEKWKEEHADQ